MPKHVISLSILAALLVSTMSLTFLVGSVNAAVTTVYIRADGSIEPSTAQISTTDYITYRLTRNAYYSIVVQRNNIVFNGGRRILTGMGSGNGIDLTGTINVTIRKIEIRGFGWGIASSLGGSSSDNKIVDSKIVSNGDGIVLYSSTNYLITGNKIAGSTFQDGIWLYACTNVQIVGNDISNNKRGGVVFATSSRDNLVAENTVAENGVGILFDSDSNKVFHNNIIDNVVQTAKRYSVSYANVWDDDYPSGGNYWSDYTGVDANRDRIGDTPYVIDANNMDRYPLMRPYRQHH